MKKPPSKYEIFADKVAKQLGLTLSAVYLDNACPPWGRGARGLCSKCKGTHGSRFQVTVTREGTNKYVSFTYWASWRDSYLEHKEAKPGYLSRLRFATDAPQGVVGVLIHKPSNYDLLTTISSEAAVPTDPDDVFRDLGGVLPSRAQAIANAAKQWHDFFTVSELAVLATVDGAEEAEPVE